MIGGLAVFALLVGFSLARGADPRDLDPVLLAIVVGTPLLIVVALYYNRMAAGPGWFSQQHVWSRTEWVRTDRLVRIESSASGVAVHLRMEDDEGRSLEVESMAFDDAAQVAARVRADVRRSLARTGPDGQPLLEIDWRSRTILLGDAPPPLR